MTLITPVSHSVLSQRLCASKLLIGCRYCKGKKLSSLRIVSQVRYHHCGILGSVEPYQAPEWASSLTYIPKTRVNLSQTYTPIHVWSLPGVPQGFTVHIKRDDLTGSALSGNKVRKLEFLLADAIAKGCRHVITCGGLQSNHCRAVALAGRQLNLIPHLFLRTDAKDTRNAGCEGNVLLDRLCDASLYLVPRKSPYLTHLLPRMQRLAEHISKSQGESSYLIPVGGSDVTGLFGYINVFDELVHQGVLEHFDDLVFPCGSGGTATGLAIANHLTGGHLRLHAITVSDDANYFYDHCDETLQEVGLGHLKSRDLLRIVDGYKGKGYGLSTDNELEFIQDVMTTTSIVLDPVYSGKTALGMMGELRGNPTAFQGQRILYLHTGGVFGLFDGRMTAFLEKKEEQQPRITMWPRVDDLPL